MKLAALLVLCALASACGLPSPSRALLDTPCPPLATEAGDLRADDLFVMSSNLPDCRHSSVNFARYRSYLGTAEAPRQLVSFAVSRLSGPPDAPWEVHETRLLTERAWLGALSDRVNTVNNRGRLIVFIHGYNNTFENVLERGTILHRLSDGSVPTLVVAWPSRGRVQSYIYDQASIAWAQDFISDLVQNVSGIATDITLVSHSMGGQALIPAIERLEDRDPAKARSVRRAILIAPDIDRHQVLREHGSLETLLKSDREVLIYTSKIDLPIRLSRNLHGYSRLGSSDCSYDVDYARRERGSGGNCHWATLHPRFQIVETAQASTARGLRHGDVFDTCPGRYDLHTFLTGGGDFPWRLVEDRDGQGGASIQPDYFAEHPEHCDEVAGFP